MVLIIASSLELARKVRSQGFLLDIQSKALLIGRETIYIDKKTKKQQPIFSNILANNSSNNYESTNSRSIHYFLVNI